MCTLEVGTHFLREQRFCYCSLAGPRHIPMELRYRPPPNSVVTKVPIFGFLHDTFRKRVGFRWFLVCNLLKNAKKIPIFSSRFRDRVSVLPGFRVASSRVRLFQDAANSTRVLTALTISGWKGKTLSNSCVSPSLGISMAKLFNNFRLGWTGSGQRASSNATRCLWFQIFLVSEIILQNNTPKSWLSIIMAQRGKLSFARLWNVSKIV